MPREPEERKAEIEETPTPPPPPEDEEAEELYRLGLSCEQAGRRGEAAAHLEKAAEIYLEKQSYGRAEEIFRHVLALTPGAAGPLNCLGIIHRRRGRPDEALKAYGKAVRTHPDDEHIYFNAARVHLDLADLITAQKYLRQAIKINPDFSEAIDLLRATEMGLKIKI